MPEPKTKKTLSIKKDISRQLDQEEQSGVLGGAGTNSSFACNRCTTTKTDLCPTQD